MTLPLDMIQGSGIDFVGFRLTLGHDVMGKNGGVIKFDNLLKAECSGIDEVAIAGLKVKCEGDYIVASADTYIQGMELLDVNGRTIKAIGGNCINVADMAAGVYLVRVHINGKTSTSKVVIR